MARLRFRGHCGGRVQIQAATRHTVDDVDSIIGVIEDISSISTSIAAAMEQQSAAASGMARSLTARSRRRGLGQLGASGELRKRARALSTTAERFVSEIRAD